MGSGGKWSMTEDNGWMEGGFFLVSHSHFSGGGTATNLK